MGSVYKDKKGGARGSATGRGCPALVELELNCIDPCRTHLPAVCVSGKSGGNGRGGYRTEAGSWPTCSSRPWAPAAPPTIPHMFQGLETHPADKTASSRDIA